MTKVSSTMLSVGTLLRRAEDTGAQVRLLVEGNWVEGRVIGCDGLGAVLDDAIAGVDDAVTYAASPGAAVGARRVVEQLAMTLQASLLVRFAPPAVADAFCATRLGGDYNGTLGTLPVGTDVASIVERTTPTV